MKDLGKRRIVRKAAAILLAVTMAFSGTVSAFAIDGSTLGGENPFGSGGSGGGELISDSPSNSIPPGGEVEVIPGVTIQPPDEGDINNLPGAAGEGVDDIPSDDSAQEDHGNEADGDADAAKDSGHDAGSTEFDDFANYLNSIRWFLYDEETGKSHPFAGPMFRSSVGDTGMVISSTIPVNTYHLTVGYECWGEVMWKMSLNGQPAFCAQPWKQASNGQYTAGSEESYTSASASAKRKIDQYTANYAASPKSSAYYAATQVLIWEALFPSVGNKLYTRMISGTEADPWTGDNGQTHPADATRIPDASARIAAYNDIKSGTNSGSGLLFWSDGGVGQVVITGSEGGAPPGDSDGDGDGDRPGDGDGDGDNEDTPFGQITIVKKDDEGKSLDGAIFNIDVTFSNGQKGGDSAFEVTDGTATFYYNHPKGNTDAATVRVTEVKAPPGYVLDTQTYTVTVRPTFTKISTDSDGNIVDSTTIAGDRKTVTFVNEEAECTLIIYKYQKGDSGIPLAGAQFDVSYVDPSVDSGRWSVTTGADGKATITLPKPGAILIQETKAPENYVIAQPNTTVTLTRGETKQVDIPNDKKGSLVIIKKDVDDGRLLPGATFEVLNIGTGHTQSVTTGPDGTVRIDGLDPGDYRVTETNPPQYYKLSTSPVQTVKILDGSTETVSVEFFNEAYGGMKIIKVDAQTGIGLGGAVFSIFQGTGVKDGYPTGQRIGDFTTSPNGSIVIENLRPGFYTIYEEQAPYGYVVDELRWQTVEVTDDNIDDTIQVIFRNQPKPKLKIIKKDKLTGEVLEGAVFRVALQNDTRYNEYTTDKNGEIYLENMDEDWYIITEMRAPSGYLLPLDPELDPVKLVAGKTTEVVVTNQEMPTLTIEKVDTVTRAPLANATFKLTKQGASEYTYVTTGSDGKAVITGLEAGWYIVEEVTAPTGYLLLEEPHNIELKPDADAVITIQNTKYPSLTIKKVDALTRNPLKNAEFTITRSDGTVVHKGLTDERGEIYIERIEPGTYKLTETAAPEGYKAVKVEQDIVIRDGEDIVITMENTALEPLYIQKIDSKTGKPLDGAVFKVEKTSGEFVGEYTTAITGYAVVTGLKPGYYVVTEIKAPNGYSLSMSPKTVRLEGGKPATVTFENDQLRGIQLIKLDEKTGKPLTGVTFKITKANGEFIGQYKTDANGLITISGLEPGAYTILEIATIEGYILDNVPKTVTLEEENPTVVTVELTNKPLAGLQIQKIDGTTTLPLSGIEFEVKTSAGTLVGKYTTSETGTIFIQGLEPGTYIVTELTTKENYTIDATPRTVVVKSGEMTTETFKNYQYPALTLKKVDSETGQPLAGAKFKLMDSAYREVGVVVTSELGLVNITKLDAGTYYVQEIQAPTGYVLDSSVRQVTLEWGKTTVLELKNTPKGSLRIQKIDSVTGKPLYNATFNIYDSKNNLLGEYTTDNAGMIIFTGQITAGKYILKEVKAPSGYVLDSTPITITVKSGETTEITIKNTPETGNIRIVKVSSDYNDITKDKKGALLKGAVFEIYNEAGDVVDRITTGEDGVAKSKDLPLGKYAIKEITSPKHYMTDGKPFYAELKVAGDLVKFEVENTPTDISTTIQKRGNLQVLPGDTMTWQFYDIKNTSSVALDEFYWHDLIPTDAVRATSFTTGVWSERVNMTAYYRTNLSSSYRVLKDNLLSTTNHELSLASSALGLKANEYVTDVKLVFGTVQAGFHETTRPTLTAYVLPNLIDGYSIVNRTDVGGRDNEEWVYSKDSWVTITLGLPRGCLPKTGFGIDVSAK